MPVVQSISIYRGEEVTLHFSMVPPRDITGWVISFTVAKNYNNPSKLFQITATITSGPNGTFDVIITSIQSDIEPGTFVYDIFRTNPGFLRILSVGEFILRPDARRP